MVPVQTLEITAVVHVAHRYGSWQMQQIKGARYKDLYCQCHLDSYRQRLRWL